MAPGDLTKATSLVDDIVNSLTGDLSELQTAPTRPNDTVDDKMARLQAQIFILTDAVEELTHALIEARQEIAQRDPDARRGRRRR